MSQYVTHNPATGETIDTFSSLSGRDVTNVLERSAKAASSWRETPLQDRASMLARVGDLYAERTEELADIIALEMGKPLAQGKGEVKLAASIYHWYAEHGPALLEDEQLDQDTRSIVRYEPLGPLLGVMPWNFPYYQVARFAAPNLLLGNTIVLKHASICARSSAVMATLLYAAGVPEDAYINVYASSEQCADMIADERIQGVTLTGSEKAGAAVAEQAGKHLKKSVLELGGSDAMIILDTNDVQAMAKQTAKARFSNCGQACNSPKRIFVPREIAEEFTDALAQAAQSWTTGDPREASTKLGPLSSEQARDDVHEMVTDAVGKGARVVTGGQPQEGPGYFYQATVMTDIPQRAAMYSEEVFGPVAAVYPYDSVDAAVEQANSSSFGLSGSVWSNDLARARDIAARLEVGMAYVNEHGTTKPGLPFGGIKRSGYGRELHAPALREFANIKLLRG